MVKIIGYGPMVEYKVFIPFDSEGRIYIDQNMFITRETIIEGKGQYKVVEGGIEYVARKREKSLIDAIEKIDELSKDSD